MKPGCFTALITPFIENGLEIDRSGLEKLISFKYRTESPVFWPLEPPAKARP
jgi:dihydrodipicolinate synthase/N-acetylneuraminate lyase